MTTYVLWPGFELFNGELARFFVPHSHGVGYFLEDFVVRRRHAVQTPQAHDLAIEKVGFNRAEPPL